MAVTMELGESSSDSKLLLKESSNKKDDLLASPASISKSELGPEKSSSQESLKQYKHWVSNERWTELKNMADNAMKERKVFTIKGGGYSAVRKALVDRGWVEKTESHRIKNVQTDSRKLIPSKKDNLSKVDKLILYKFMEHHSVDFLWTSKRDKYDWLLSNRDVIISRFCRSIFTSKEGLCASLNQMHWHTEPGVSVTHFPRCYNIHNPEHLDEFVDDFRITACISLLKWLSITLKTTRESDMVCFTGKVPFAALEFAMMRLKELIEFFTHGDIDNIGTDINQVWECEWDQFLTHHYLLVHEKAKFIEDVKYSLRTIEKKSSVLLGAVSKFRPQTDIDGVLNIWIVKPGNKCRGRGIQLMNNIKDIIGLVNVANAPKCRYVVQKYIENPLIIYNTKFDIRQWFLITCCQPLTIWMYKDSYLRFSSQIFNLSNYHESVHLTNNAVQSRYKNTETRDKALPDENMWDNHTFKTYLRQIGQAEMWDTRIYPGMKQCLVGAMLANQETMDKRLNSFELYGADFMLTEDFTPWLIEINSSPDLAPTTSVTARLCPQCLEDLIKVVVDRRTNPDSDTGTFELVYRQFIPKAPAYLGLALCLNGKKIVRKLTKAERKLEFRSSLLQDPTLPGPPLPSSTNRSETDIAQKIPSAYAGPIITDFMAWLNPYDTVPVDKNGIVLPAEPKTLRSAFTAINSRYKTNSTTKVTKRKGSREKRKVLQGSRDPDDRLTEKSSKLSHENKETHQEDKLKSVGNKRCYIEPQVSKRESYSALKTAHSNNTSKESQRTLKTGGVYGANRVFGFKVSRSASEGKSEADKISAVGHNINKLNKEYAKENYSRINTLYGPYRMDNSAEANVQSMKNIKKGLPT